MRCRFLSLNCVIWTTKRSAEEWQVILSQFWDKVLEFSDEKDQQGVNANSLTAASLKGLPTAKKDLRGRAFRPRRSMPCPPRRPC